MTRFVEARCRRVRLCLALAGGLALAGFAAPAGAVQGVSTATFRLAGAAPQGSLSADALSGSQLQIDVQRLRSGPQTEHVFPLPGGGRDTLVFARRDTVGADAFVWHGRVRGDSMSIATFAVVHGTVVGSVVTSRNRLYRVRVTGSGKPLIEEIDPRRIPPDETGPLESAVPGKSVRSIPICPGDDADRIDVMVLYTSEALVGAGGDDAMEATIHLAVGETNQTWINSGVAARLSLVHLAEAAYAEAGDTGRDLAELLDTGTDLRKDADELRDRYLADVVVLLTEEGGTTPEKWAKAGLSKIPETVSASNEANAFSVVVRRYATGVFTFGHEIGHLLSARHDWADDDDGLPFEFNHGIVTLSPSHPGVAPWMTVMGSRTTGYKAGVMDCVRLPYWSSPALPDYEGDPLGSEEDGKEADNVLTVNKTAATVAMYRCASLGRTDTWMKDAWADTGEEPEPLLAGEAMWKSPYIWVRRVADPGHVHAHEHENPVAHTDNFIYVKLHNGTEGGSGTLEIYVAKASTGLVWPADWSLVSSQAVTSLGAGETRIVEASWYPVEGGHYCLLARWSSPDDPMTTPEGSDINDNVRANNNLVWRNVNIIDLSSAREIVAGLSLRNDRPAAMHCSLELRPERVVADSTRALPGGVISLRLGRRLLDAWGRAGGRGTGFVRRGDLIVLDDPRGAVLEGIPLALNERVPIQLVVRREGPTKAWRRPLRVDVIQRDTGTPQSRVVGGVSYEIEADERDR